MKNNMKKFSKGKYHDNEDGVALIFALGFLSVLLMVGLAFATSALLERKLAINNRSAVQGKLLADSAASHVMGSLQSSIMNNYDATTKLPNDYISPSAGFLTITNTSSPSAPNNIKDRPLMMSVSLDGGIAPQKISAEYTDADTAKLVKKELREQLQERIVDPSSTTTPKSKIDVLVWNDTESIPAPAPSAVTLAANIEDWLNWTNIVTKGATTSDPDTITGRYAYIIEDITGKLNINDVIENKTDDTTTTTIDESKLGILNYNTLTDKNGANSAFLGTFSTTPNIFYISTNELFNDSSITTWNKDKVKLANNLFSPAITKEPEIFLRPSTTPTTIAGTYHHKTLVDKTELELLRDDFISTPTVLASKIIKEYDPIDTGLESKGIEFFHKIDTTFDKGSFTNQNDRLNQIAANFFDFFDEDFTPTCDIPPTKTDLTIDKNPKFFGNEMFPQISEISIGIGGYVERVASSTTAERAKARLYISPAIELTDIYDIANKYPNLTYEIEISLKVTGKVKLRSNLGLQAEQDYSATGTISTNPSRKFELSQLTSTNNFYIAYNNGGYGGFLKPNNLPTQIFRSENSDDDISAAQLNIETVEIIGVRLMASGTAGAYTFNSTVVDFVKPGANGTWSSADFEFDHSGDSMATLFAESGDKNKALCTMQGESRHQLFTVQVKDPRVNLKAGGWIRESRTDNTLNYLDKTGIRYINIPDNPSDPSKNKIKGTTVSNMGKANEFFNSATPPVKIFTVQNLFVDSVPNDQNNDYKTNIAKDFETVDSFARLRHYFPNQLKNSYDLAAIGNISRAKAFQTLNVSKFNKNGYIGKYDDGDANILQQLKLSGKIESINGKYNYKSVSTAPLQALLLEAFNTSPDIFKDYLNNNIGVIITDNIPSNNDIIEEIKTSKEPTNYDAFNASNNRFKALMTTTSGTAGTDPEIYNYYGFKDIELMTKAIKKSYNTKSLTNIGQQQVEFLTSAIIAKSSPRYFYYQVNIIGQSITDLETGPSEVDHKIDIGGKLKSTDSSTVYTLKSKQGRYDPYVDVINSTDKVKAIIRWDSKTKKFEVISYKKLEI